MAKSSKNQVVMSHAEKSRAKTSTSPFSSRRASKPKKSTAFMVEAMEPAAVSRRMFFIGRKSDVYSKLAETKYIVIDGVPHKRVGNGYVALTAKSSNVTPETVMLKQLEELASQPDTLADLMYDQLLKLSKA